MYSLLSFALYMSQEIHVGAGAEHQNTDFFWLTNHLRDMRRF
jgi:hypothetical protein